MIIANNFTKGEGFIVSDDGNNAQINLCVLANCSFKCSYCTNQQYPKQKTDFVELSSLLVDTINTHKISTLSIQSGDFFVDKELSWVIDKVLLTTNVSLHLFSNGFIFSIKRLQKLGWLERCNSFTLSIYGLSDEEYFKKVGVKGAFTKVIENYNEIKKLVNLNIELNVNVLTENKISEENKYKYKKILLRNNINFREVI